MKRILNLETIDTLRERERERATLYSTWNPSTRPSILNNIKKRGEDNV